jgi:two-component system response regulator NreC
LGPMSTESMSAKKKIRCLLVNDHVLLRQGVRRLLEDEPDFEVVDEAANATGTLQKLLEHRPDILLMSLGMPGFSAFEAARMIRRNSPDTRLMFLTMHQDDNDMQGSQAGLMGYVLKDNSAPGLVSAIRDVHHGSRAAGLDALNQSVEEVPCSSEGGRMVPRTSALTPREREVVKMLAEGNSVREIASHLGLSPKTVDTHKFNLMRKLNIHNKARLVRYAIQKKIVGMPAEA